MALALCAFTPLTTQHDTTKKTDDEFVNVYYAGQPKQFRVVESTPILSELQDNEVVIFSSGAVKLMWRDAQEIYAVTGSCVTVRR